MSHHARSWTQSATPDRESERDFPRREFTYSRTSLGVAAYVRPHRSFGIAGHLVYTTGALAPLVIGELVQDADKRWRLMRLVSVGTAMAYETLHVVREEQRRKEQKPRLLNVAAVATSKTPDFTFKRRIEARGGRYMAEGENTSVIEALRLLLAFEKSGAKTFDLTITDREGRKVHFRHRLTPYRLRWMMPDLLRNSTTLQHNVIVRPRTGPDFEHIQLDDLTVETVERVKPAAFLCLQTSPGNYQAWVAVRDAGDPDFARRLRKGTGADPSASGATRVTGHPNFKDKYAPNFPRVEITHVAPGRIASKDELEGQGLVAPREEPKPSRPRVSPTRSGVRKWPSYERCVENAPPNRGNTAPDISRADFTWCVTALDWGWSVEEVADQLMVLSVKVREEGERYALLSAQNAAAAVERRRSHGRIQ